MNIEKDLKKDGITVIEPVNPVTVTLIAKFVCDKLCTAFPLYNLNYDNLFIKVVNTPMFIAKIPNGMSEANYFYKNSTIYFKEGLSVDEMKTFAIHEFLHRFQEKKDNKNILYRLGLCDFTGLQVKGMALNEGSVQYMTSKALKNDFETVKYYGIEFTTNSTSCYPLLCNLVRQMAYITGEQVLFDSTLYSNDNFKKCFIGLCGQAHFYKIQDNLDKLLHIEEKLTSLVAKVQQNVSENKITIYSNQITKLKNNITKTYRQTQNLILTSYFDKQFHQIYSTTDLEEYRKKLYNFKDYIGIIENDSFFNEYYIHKMNALSDKYDAITQNVYLVTYQNDFFHMVLRKLNATMQAIRKVYSSSQDINH